MMIAGCQKLLHVVWVSAATHHIGTTEGSGIVAWTAGSGMLQSSGSELTFSSQLSDFDVQPGYM
jgi:hypothetical protein